MAGEICCLGPDSPPEYSQTEGRHELLDRRRPEYVGAPGGTAMRPDLLLA